MLTKRVSETPFPGAVMIQNSFIFLERIKRGLEESLWRQGIDSWDSFLAATKVKGLSISRKRYYDRKIIEARRALYNFDSSYFKKILPQSEYYRLYDFFRDECVFLGARVRKSPSG